jgi:hypothetical protein
MMNFAVMPATQRDRELITDSAAECGALRRAQMVGISRAPAANKAWLLGNRFDVLPIANPTRHWERQDAFVNYTGSAPLYWHRWASKRRLNLLHPQSIAGVAPKACQPRLKCCPNTRGICCSESVFGAKNPMSPTCGFFG